MNFKTTILLIVVLAVAGIFLFISERKGGDEQPTPTQSSTAEGKKVFDIDAKDVTHAVITPAEGAKWVLSKDKDGAWQFEEPLKSSAERWSVDDIVRGITDLRSTGQVDATGGSAKTGLDKPSYQVELTATDGKTVKAAIGDKTAIGDQMYLKVGDASKADLVGSDVYDKLDKSLNDLRDKRLISVSSLDVHQVEIDRGGKKLLLQKPGADWKIVEPTAMPADDTEVNSLLSSLTLLEATDFVDAAGAKVAQLDRPTMTIQYSTIAPSTQPSTQPASQPVMKTITFGGFDSLLKEKVYAKVSDPAEVVKVSASSTQPFDKTALDLRDKKVLEINGDQVSRVELSADVAAVAKPTTKPALKKDVIIERRKVVPAAPVKVPLAATVPAAPTVQPTTGPLVTTKMATEATANLPVTTGPSSLPTTTQVAASKPATEPVKEPPTKWVLKGGPADVDAGDATVAALLTQLNPLRAEKFKAGTPAAISPVTQPSGQYVLKVRTEGPGGTPVTDYEVRLTDPGNGQSVVATYNDLTFEVNRSLLDEFVKDFSKSAQSAAKPAPAESMPMQGMPMQGMPQMP